MRCCRRSPDQFEALWPYLRQLDGFNVTIPYKQQIIPFCAQLDDTAKRYGAVNVVDCKNGGVGYNTDCVGFLRSLEGIPLKGEVLVAGAGGVGRMFAVESARHGARVTLAVRQSSIERALELQREMEREIPGAAARVVTLDSLPQEEARYRWLINATPAGMYPKVDDMPLDPSVLPRCENVFEAIYNPVQTKLMRLAQQVGCRRNRRDGDASLAGSAGPPILVWRPIPGRGYRGADPGDGKAGGGRRWIM